MRQPFGWVETHTLVGPHFACDDNSGHHVLAQDRGIEQHGRHQRGRTSHLCRTNHSAE